MKASKRIGAREARNHFADLLDQMRRAEEPVIIERSGKPVAVVISIEQFEQLQAANKISALQSDLPQANLLQEARPAYVVPHSPVAPKPLTSSQTSVEPFKSFFGIFPELAELEIDKTDEEIDALWQASLQKQIDILSSEA